MPSTYRVVVLVGTLLSARTLAIDIPYQLSLVTNLDPLTLPLPTIAEYPTLYNRVQTDEAFASLPTGLQRAVLWDVGLVRLGSSTKYTQIYTQCTDSMNDIFLTAQSMDSTRCSINADCKGGVQSVAVQSCDPAAIVEQTACAVIDDSNSLAVPEWNNITMYSKTPAELSWGYDPEIYAHDLAEQDNASSMVYTITQFRNTMLEDLGSSDNTCLPQNIFVVPCRKIASSQIEIANSLWCMPERLSSVTSWQLSVNSTSNTTSAGMKTGSIIAIALSVFALLLATGVFAFCYRQRKRKFANTSYQESLLVGTSRAYSAQPVLNSDGTTNTLLDVITAGSYAPWEDNTIVGSRLPREKVVVGVLLSRGAYGEVYKGAYLGDVVAVKMLLPETRKILKHVTAFLTEAKLMAALEHPSIVLFVGVAWNSLSDLCVISEYMTRGDLRGLLIEYEDKSHPKGFDYTKIKIAHHIAHALTYLHSLEQPVLHRDLKSKNVLLDSELNAKLTDFGVSREWEDRTMTAGVGTSLWMAPEVMIGGKYDDKADMFSFGVLLSELDCHLLPYSHAREKSDSGRKMPDAAILQMVAAGALRVQFSENALPEVIDLGLACVAMDPKARPAAPEVLYKLQKVMQSLYSTL